MCKTVSFQILNSKAKNNSFQLVRTAFPSLLFSFPFFLKKRSFFSRCEGRDHWFHRSSVPDGRNYTACNLPQRVAQKYEQNLSPRQTHS